MKRFTGTGEPKIPSSSNAPVQRQCLSHIQTDCQNHSILAPNCLVKSTAWNSVLDSPGRELWREGA
jgi:hypothetical protein